jgi:hypothetical protein
VTTTPAITFFPGVVDNDQKYPKSLKFIASVNDITEKLFTGVNNTTDKFFASVNDTADKTVLTKPACLDLKIKNKQKLSLIPVINLLSPAITFFPGVIDNSQCTAPT